MFVWLIEEGVKKKRERLESILDSDHDGLGVFLVFMVFIFSLVNWGAMENL